MHGFDARTPSLEVVDNPMSKKLAYEENENVLIRLKHAHKLAAQAISEAQTIQKEKYDLDAKPTHLQMGDLVLITHEWLKEGQCKKFGPKYTGPFKIVGFDYPNVELKQLNRNRKRTMTVHLQRVKKFYGNPSLLEKLAQGRMPELNRCGACKLRYAKEDGRMWIGCDGCLEWYHFECQDLKEEPDRQIWYCRRCILKPGMRK